MCGLPGATYALDGPLLPDEIAGKQDDQDAEQGDDQDRACPPHEVATSGVNGGVKPAMWRRKSVPAWLGEELVPEVHGRAPRALRRALNRQTRRRAWEGPVGPRGQADGAPFWWPAGLGFVFGFALLEPEALAIHLEDNRADRKAGRWLERRLRNGR